MPIIRFITAVLLLLSCREAFAGELIQVPAAIQISSCVSDGKYSIPEIVRICRQRGFKVVIITDRDLMRWEYGLWPLRNVIKKTVETGSILKYGSRRYLKEFERIRAANPGMVIIPAIESAPFYYWTGGLWRSNLGINDWHKHIISIGLEDYKALDDLPVAGNKRGLAEPFGWKNLFLFWPLLLLAAALACFKNSRGPRGILRRNCGIAFIIAGALFLAENYPFVYQKFDQYNRKAGIGPYQNYIDYVNTHKGLTFWAHPEAMNIERAGAVFIRTSEHSLDIMRTRDYTGFAVFYEGYKTVGKPGGIWDRLLEDYCAGKRKKPLWAIGALAFDSEGELEDAAGDLRTVLLVPELNEEEVLKALKNGRMYTIRGSDSSRLVLEKFSVSAGDDTAGAAMGQSLSITAAAQVRIKAYFLNGQSGPLQIKLIRNGEIIKKFEAEAPVDIVYSDRDFPAEGGFYYRLEIDSKNGTMITNPVFVRKTANK